MESFTELAGLLAERRRIIADHDWRGRDAASHLEALKSVSEKITAAGQSLGLSAPPKLRHFLENCSYDKALAWLTEMSEATPRPPEASA